MSAGAALRHATRRCVVAALASGALAVATARSQTRAAPRRIGVLWPGGRRVSAAGSAYPDFHDRLRALGWIDGDTVVIEERFAEGQLDRLPELARELVALRVEVIVAAAQAAADAARAATATIPIVMIHTGNPIGSGLIRSLARPGGNVTGTTSMMPDLAGKQLEMLRKLAPSTRRVAVLGNPTNAGHLPAMANAREAAPSLGLEILPLEIVRTEDVEPTAARIAEARPDAMLVMGDPLISFHAKTFIELAERARMPAIYAVTNHARTGGLIGLGPDLSVHYPRAAEFVDRILRGANPAELPVEQPTTFELVINLRAARALGLEIPPTILSLADEVVE